MTKGVASPTMGYLTVTPIPVPKLEAARIYDNARAQRAASPLEHEQFASFLMVYFGHLDCKRGWTKQLHLGPLRSANTRKLRELGPDTGFDSIGDFPQAAALSAYFDLLESEQALPRTIIYNNNPADNYVFATAAGNFQDESTPGKDPVRQWHGGFSIKKKASSCN